MNDSPCETCQHYDKFYAVREGKWMNGLAYQGVGRCLNKTSNWHLVIRSHCETCEKYQAKG